MHNYQPQPQPNLFFKMSSSNQVTVAIAAEGYSFYIPRVRVAWTADEILTVFTKFFGIVLDRVDLGEVLTTNSLLRAAFVHMGPECRPVAEFITANIVANKFYKMQISRDEFWMILPNNNPIPKTELNVHQLAEITRKQKERIDFLENQVEELNKIVALYNSATTIVPLLPPSLVRQTNKPAVNTPVSDICFTPESLSPCVTSIRVINSMELCGNH